MVKLTRILKNEYRDDVDKSKRGRRSSSRKKKHSREPSTREAQDRHTHDVTEKRREDITKLPPALLKILQAHAPGYHKQADADREEREQAEPMTHNSTDSPHHSALTRAAQMALRSIPGSSDGIDDQSSDPSTMALIDSIVQTSDDPALIEALQAMMGDASGQSHQQRETLALVAESIMEKKAAKEALKRAVLAESRLHESLKKCAPELSGDAATFVAAEVDACVIGDANATPTPLLSNHAHTSPGFFNRINKSFTNSSQSAHRRLQFVKTKNQVSDKTSRKTSKSKSKSSKSVPRDDIVVLDQSGTGDVEHPSDEPVFLMSTQPFPSTKEESKQVFVKEEVVEVKEKDQDEGVGETRDDQEVSRTKRSPINNAAVADDTGTTPSKRLNKYRHIANIEPDLSHSHARSTSWKARAEAENQSAHGETVGQSTYRDGQNETTVANGSDVSSSTEEDDGSDTDTDEEENGDEVVKVEYKAEGEALAKIEYTIFELESKLSMSSGESSVASPFSAESSQTGDNDDDEEDVATDSDTLEDVEEDAAVHEGEEEGVSDFGEEEEEKEEDESETESDDDNSLLFASFCQRPEASIDNEEVNDEDDDETSHDRRHQRGDGSHREVDSGEVRSLLKCVSVYFGVNDGVDEKKKRRSRRSRRREHRRHRD
jgi:hypothetical protein